MWEKVKWRTVLDIRNGKNQSKVINPEGCYPIYGSGGLMGYADDYLCPAQTTIIGRKGSINNPIFVNSEFWNVDTAFGLVAKKSLSPKYLYYFCKTYNFLKLDKSTTLPSLTKSDLLEIEIPLPPLPIQEKIAEILDKADELRRKDKDLQAKYDELAQTIFIDMFGDPVKNEKSWEVKRLEEFIDSIVDVGSNGANEWVSKNIQMKDVEDYAIMIRTTNLANNDFLKNLKYVGKETYELFKKTKVYGGEIIMNKIGSAGDFWSMPYLNRPVSLGLNQLMIKISNINQVFLLNQMSIESYKKLIKSKTQGAITKSITKGAVKALELIVPPIHLQEAFAKKIELINQLKAQTNTAKSEELFQSLLQKAFKGELVN